MKKWIPDIICGLLILLFAYTAFSKILAFRQFRSGLSTAPLIENYSTFFAALIPAAELIIVVLLLIPKFSKTGLITASSILIVFTAYLIFMVLTDPNRPCSCSGVIQQLSWKQHIAFNIFFIGLSTIGIYFQHQPIKGKHRTKIL
jgi:hypothetical protein